MFNSIHHQDPKHLGKVLVERGIDSKNILNKIMTKLFTNKTRLCGQCFENL